MSKLIDLKGLQRFFDNIKKLFASKETENAVSAVEKKIDSLILDGDNIFTPISGEHNVYSFDGDNIYTYMIKPSQLKFSGSYYSRLSLQDCLNHTGAMDSFWGVFHSQHDDTAQPEDVIFFCAFGGCTYYDKNPVDEAANCIALVKYHDEFLAVHFEF